MSDWIANSLSATPDTLATVAVDEQEPWETISLFHKQYSPTLLLGIFPSYLQLDLRFYRAVRQLGMSSLTVPQEQMQAGLALIESFSIGGIVTTGGALQQCLNDLRTFAPKSDPYVQVVLDVHERPFKVPDRVFFEIQATPGIPLLYQCPHLKEHFHTTNKFSAELFPASVSVSKQACACGNDSLAQLP